MAAQPTNDLPNPYRTVADFFKMPEGRTWGSTSAVDVDATASRSGSPSAAAPTPASGRRSIRVLKFDATGKLVKSFGAGMMIFPHGMHVDKDGNIWVTDGQDNKPRRRARRARRTRRCRRRRRRSTATRCSSSAPTASC